MVLPNGSELDQLSRLIEELPDGDDESNELLLVPAFVRAAPKVRAAARTESVFEESRSREIPRRWLAY